MDEMQELIDSLKIVNKLMEKDTIKNATNEQLLEYIELTNQIKAMIIASL